MNLGWRRTWEESYDDYVLCDDSGQTYGRIYYGHMRHWLWFFGGSSGYTVSRREAMIEVEALHARYTIASRRGKA